MGRSRRAWPLLSSVAGLSLGLAMSCTEPRDEGSPFDDTGGTCPIGAETCPCTQGGFCDEGLECRSGLCVEGDPDDGPGPTTGADGGSTAADTTPGDASDDGIKLDVGANDIPLDTCEQDVDVVFTMDVSTTMTFFFDALLADMAEVDAALQSVGANPRYGLVVFVDDYEVVDMGVPFEDIASLQAEFQTWKTFTTSFAEPQIHGGTNTTFPENSLDALWHAAQDFQWRPAQTTLRLVIHATDDTMSEAPAVLDGIAVEHSYDETVTALQGQEVRVAAFAATVGGSIFFPTNVSAGWFGDWSGGQPAIPTATGGSVYLIDGITNGTLSLGDAIVETVQEVECTPYPEG
ncbi:MAG: VWA domain-containing protein [Myxococcales bacterium]|nr:VWA domain-containing protein [Myxococcales bacterium]MCB9718357.1 VWA domain-containing protein [Myxococcales bacterium]